MAVSREASVIDFSLNLINNAQSNARKKELPLNLNSHLMKNRVSTANNSTARVKKLNVMNSHLDFDSHRVLLS